MSIQPDLLILAAHTPELLGLASHLSEPLSGTIEGVRVSCATVGVGLPIAGVGAMRHLQDIKPRAVVLLGSCGLYPRDAAFAPLIAVIPNVVRVIDPNVLDGHAAFPLPMQARAECDRALADGLAEIDAQCLCGDVATTLSITTDDDTAAKMGARSGCCAENLEAFSAALACAALALPVACVLIATNEVGSRGREQWFRQQRAAADRGANLLLDWLRRGAPGLDKNRA
jgi:nucleoside phosphorylase